MLVAGCQCLQCQLPFTVEHAHVDAARRPVSPHQSGRLNDERRVIPKEHAEVVQLSSQVRPRLPLGRIGPEGGGQELPRLGCVSVDGPARGVAVEDGAQDARRSATPGVENYVHVVS